jgi:hypothetical protein
MEPEVINTPFGRFLLIDGRAYPLSGQGTVTDTPPVPTPPAAAIKISDPAIAHTTEAKTDAEAIEFMRIRRVSVYVNGVTLAHKYWETRSRLEAFEQQALADDRGALLGFQLANYVPLVESIAPPSGGELTAIAASFSNRRVYFGGQEVKA